MRPRFDRFSNAGYSHASAYRGPRERCGVTLCVKSVTGAAQTALFSRERDSLGKRDSR